MVFASATQSEKYAFEATQVHPGGQSVGPEYPCPPPSWCYKAIPISDHGSSNAYIEHKGSSEVL